MPVPMNRAALQRLDPELRELLEAMIENIETLTGQRPDLPPIRELPPGASLGDAILKVNEKLRRDQG